MQPCARFVITMTLTAIALLTLAPRTSAQVPLLERGEEMQKLERFLGAWEGQITRHLPNGATWELANHVNYTWDVGEAWLKSHDAVPLPDGATIQAMMWMTWHAKERRYHGGWQDNVFPQIVLFTATWKEEGDALVLDSGLFDIGGRPHRVVQTFTFVSDDEYRTEMRQAWGDDEPKLVAEGRFTRVAEDGAEA